MRVRAAVVATAIVLVVTGAVSAAGAAPAARPASVKWPSQLAPIAKKVASIRRLRFEHSVPVHFADGKAFDKKVTADVKHLTKKQKDEIHTATLQLAALGLVPADTDLLKAFNDTQSSGVLAFYDPDDQEIWVKGKKGRALDVPTRVTLAHELTHVLQDQHFDLKKIEDDADKGGYSDAARAVIEGDASWVEDQYKTKLSKADRDAYDTWDSSKGADVKKDLADVPEIVPVIVGAPYALGPSMIQTLRSDGGEKSVDGAFEKPPKSSLTMIDPLALLEHRAVKKVPTPTLRKGESHGKPDEFGALPLYITLSGRMSPQTALAATLHWAGDRMVSYRKGEAGCVRADFVGAKAADTKAIADALTRWAAAGPAGAASVASVHGRVRLDACTSEPGPAAPSGQPFTKAIAVVGFRSEIFAELLSEGAPRSISTCSADGVVDDPQIVDAVLGGGDAEPTEAQIAAVRERIQSVVKRCAGR